MKAAILVGGKGLRLKPLTNHIPKPLVPIFEGKTFLEYLFDWLKLNKIRDVVLLTGHMSKKFEEYCGDGSNLGMNIEYSKVNEPLGTAGQLKPARNLLTETFILLNGDSIFPIELNNLLKFHKEKNAQVSIALHKIKDTSRSGVVVIDAHGKVTNFVEKPDTAKTNTINAGVYIVEPEIFNLIPDGKCSLEKEIYPKIGRLFAKEFKSYFIDIGLPKTYNKFKQDMKDLKKIF